LGIEAVTKDGTLAVARREDDGTVVFSIEGELDLANAATLEREMTAVRGTTEVVLDMSALEFIDSTGIALLIAAHRRLNGDGARRFSLVRSRSNQVRKVLELTGIDTEVPYVAPPPA
jgi:anti-anti-sigma factor